MGKFNRKKDKGPRELPPWDITLTPLGKRTIDKFLAQHPSIQVATIPLVTPETFTMHSKDVLTFLPWALVYIPTGKWSINSPTIKDILNGPDCPIRFTLATQQQIDDFNRLMKFKNS